MSAPEFVVIGAGIVGVAAAAFLAEGGARVMLYESVGIAAGASGANSGVVQHPFHPALAALYLETVDLYRTLSDTDTGFRLPDQPAGLLFISRQQAAVQRLAASVVASFPDLRSEMLEGPELQALEPTLAPDLKACLVQIGYPVPPSAPTYAYAALAERRGVVIRLGRRAIPEIEKGRVVGVRVDDRVMPASAVLVAAGPWTCELIDPTGRWRPIRSLWGVVVETALAAPPRHTLEEAEIDSEIGVGEPVHEVRDHPASSAMSDPVATSRFSLVSAGGMSSVGSTFLDSEPNPGSWIVPLLERGTAFVPGLADAPVHGVRVCARPQTADGVPLVGDVPGVAGLYVCAGHGAWGISTGPASARRVADLMLGFGVPIAPALAAGRFGSPIVG